MFQLGRIAWMLIEMRNATNNTFAASCGLRDFTGLHERTGCLAELRLRKRLLSD